MKFSLFSLILVCFGILASSRRAPQPVDKFSHIMNALTQPYTDAFENMRNNTAASYKHLQSLLTSGLNSADEDNKLKRTNQIFKDKNLDNEDVDYDEEETSQTSRILQSVSCSTGSVSVTATVNVYNCSGIEVTRTEYDSRNAVNCTITPRSKSLCYCRYDFYGDRCENRNEYSCEIERVSHPLNCEGVDSFNYVYSYSGIPPCHPVEVGQAVAYKTKAICRPLNSEYEFEGIKHSKYEVITQPTVSTNFTYQISNDRIHITTAPSPVIQTISFTNWKKMSEPILFVTTLTVPQLAGQAEIVTNIDFSSPLSQAATTGRYYFEISMSTSSSPRMITRSYNGGYFEQAGYQEPPAPPKANKALIIALPIVGGVLVIALIVGYKLYQRKKLQREKESVDIAPLVADQ